jgi:osmotically-inducible protein OsmY
MLRSSLTQGDFRIEGQKLMIAVEARTDLPRAAAAEDGHYEALANSIKKRLHECGYLSLRNVSCECRREGVVILRGQVRSFYLKQLAQAHAQTVVGVRRVNNDVEVVASPPPADRVADDRRR